MSVAEPSVLLVDDDDVSRSVLAIVLKRSVRATVTEAESAERALSLLDGGLKPDLFVLDARMPRVTGYELCRKLRDDPRWEASPIVVLSARSGPAAIDDAMDAGADEVMFKPFDPLTIGDVLGRLLALRRGHKGRRLTGAGASEQDRALGAAVDTLRPRFKRTLLALADELAGHVDEWRVEGAETLAHIQVLVHRLAGTAGSYGMTDLSRAAREIDLTLEGGESTATGDLLTAIERLVTKMRAEGQDR